MSFDADAWLAAHRPWSVTLGGREYVSRPVSILEVVAFQTDVQAASGQFRRQMGLVRGFLRKAFPWRWRYLWHGDPVARILALDDEARGAVLADFFESVLARLRRMSPTNGTRSGEPTVPPNRSDTAAPAP